jgi:membrane protein DedA with SNARE-associated domain
VFGLPYRRFAATLIVARGLRYLVWGLMGIFYGDEALAFLQAVDRWSSKWGLTALAVVSVAVLVALLVWSRRRRSKRGREGTAA